MPTRPLLPVLALAAVLAAAAGAAAVPTDGSLDAEVSLEGDGQASASAAGVGVDAEPGRTVEVADEVAGDVLETADGAAGTSFSGSSGEGAQVQPSDRIALSGEAASQAAGAASIVVLAAYALSKLEGLAWLRRVAGVAVVPLYSRMDRSEILDHETRQEMYDLIRDEAGISMQEIADEVGCGWGTVVYHLEKLEDEGFVTSEHTGGRRRFFAAGEVEPDDKDAVGVLRQDTPRAIMAYLLEHPGANQSELTEALDIAASTASKHLGRLEEAGLVDRERDWRKVHYRPAEGVAERVPSAPSLDEAGGSAAAPA